MKSTKKEIIATSEYYDDKGTRELCHRLKENEEAAIYQAAIRLADKLPKSLKLIPIPISSGKADYTLKLCQQISSLRPDLEVNDCLISFPRESLYELKKKGKNLLDTGFKIEKK